MRLTEEQLWTLESAVEDNVRYLRIRTGEESTNYFKMTFPSPAQHHAAKLSMFKYRSELCKNKDIPRRWDLEKENKDALKEIRDKKDKLRRRKEDIERDFVQRKVAGMPDVEKDADAAQAYVDENTSELQEVNRELTHLVNMEFDMLSSCVEQMEDEHFAAVLTQQCWYCLKDGTQDEWELVWPTFEAFQNDHNVLARRLIAETRLWVGGGSFFGI